MTRVFGVPLPDILQRDINNGLPIPYLAKQIMDILTEGALNLEGLFRISGNSTDIDKYKYQIDKGDVVDFRTENDPHTLAGLFKLYIRNLPDPLLTHDLYNDFLSIQDSEVEEKMQKLQELVGRLPPENRTFLTELLHFLKLVSTYSTENKMTESNLAIVFGPNLLKSNNEMLDVMRMVQIPKVVQVMIENAETLCPKIN